MSKIKFESLKMHKADIYHLFYAPVTSHTVNLLSALPLQCLDVLLMGPLEPGSEQCRGVNMECVHTLVLFMERRLELVRERERLSV